MPLKAYKRRHSTECLNEIARRVHAGELAEYPDLEHYRHCKCTWWVRGTTDFGKLIPRQSLKAYTWEAASAAIRKLNQDESAAKKATLMEAKTQWLAEVRLNKRTEATLALYEGVADKLIDFVTDPKKMGNNGKLKYAHEVTTIHINLLRAEWEKDAVALSSHRNQLTNLSTFFKFCVRMDYVKTNPLDKVQRPRAIKPKHDDIDEDEASENATMPYDEEGDAVWQKIRALLIPYLRNEIARPGQERRRARRGELTSNPENFLALVELMYETGLRISDALHFDPDKKMRINAQGQGIYTTRQIKTRNFVTVMLEPWLVEKIQALPRLGNSRFVFFDGRKNWKRFITNNVANVLREFGDTVGIEEVRCHRFRDSFAINQLNMGVPITLLKDLLGHKNLAMTERYYAPWVKSRGDSTVEQADRIRQAHRSGKLVTMPERRQA